MKESNRFMAYKSWDLGKRLKDDISETPEGRYRSTSYFQRGDQYYQIDNESRDMQLARDKSDLDWSSWVSKDDSTAFKQNVYGEPSSTDQSRLREITLEDWEAIKNPPAAKPDRIEDNIMKKLKFWDR